MRRFGALFLVAGLFAAACAATPPADPGGGAKRVGPAANHAVRAQKLRTIMAELDQLRSRRIPQELDTQPGQAAHLDDVRAAAEALAYAAADIPAVLTEVRLTREDEDLFYSLAERLGVAALELRDRAIGDDMTAIHAAFDDIVASCDACHRRFRVMPAAEKSR
jgi:cytochrome c556